MDMIAIYRNFWTRNLVIVIVCLLIIFGCVYDVDPEVNETREQFYWVFAKISRGFIPLYIAMIFSNTVLVRQLFFRKKYVFFIISFLVFWSSYHILIQYYYDWAQLGKPTSLAIQLGKVSLLLSVIAISNGTAMYFLHLWILRNITESQKEIMTIESELTFLKQQLNPHFLLNVMNNLYGESLALPESVPDRILNVSDLLRYQIEATKRDVVPLEEEIEFIKKYIAYYTFSNERLEIEQTYNGNSDGITIPPLFFLPLVENAVKFSGETAKPYIHLNLTISGRDLSFSMQNNFLIEGSRTNGTGIGIDNLKRRLEVYGISHNLSCEKDDAQFQIQLNLWELPTVA